MKGIDMLLDAFDSLAPSSARLEIAGAVEDDWGAALVERCRGRTDIRFLGELSDPAAFLRSLDAYVLPSRSEGMSMALLEAMASGLPIVATDVGSNRELLNDGKVGILVQPLPHAIADGIQALLRDPESALRAGAEARRRVEAEYRLETMVETYMRLYASLAAIER